MPDIKASLVHRCRPHEYIRSIIQIVLGTADANYAWIGSTAYRSKLTDEDRDAGIEVLSIVADHCPKVRLVIRLGASVSQVLFPLVHDDQFDPTDTLRFRYRLAIERGGVEMIRRIAIRPPVINSVDP